MLLTVNPPPACRASLRVRSPPARSITLTVNRLRKYYIGGWNNGQPNDAWCSICNPFEFLRSVMTNPAQRANIRDVSALYHDLAHGVLPSVAFVRPYEGYAGHPGNSTLSSYEDFVLNLANTVISQPELFASTAILVTTDEGGGYYDSGYRQALDFF